MAKHDLNRFKKDIGLVWRLSLPAILTQITTILMQYIDTAMVGKLGANASASIGLVASSTWLFNGFTYAVAAGFSVQVAHHIGAEKDRDARTVVRHGLIFSFLLSAVLCLTGILISGKLPVWLGGEEAVVRDSSLYFFVFSLMLPFTQLNALVSSYMQCSGDMVTPSILNAVMCALDVIFNAIFIPRLGVLGAGIGTMLACLVISLLQLWLCVRKNPRLKLSREEKWKFDREIIKKAIKIGVPVAVQEVAMNSAMVASTAIIAPLGSVAVAANSFAITAESICYMPGYGIGSAATTLVGRSVGAGEEKRAKRYGNLCTVLGGAFMGMTGLVMMIVCPLVFSFLTHDPSVRALATSALRIGLLAEPLFGVSIVAAGSLRGAGDTFIPSIMNVLSIWVVRIGLAKLLVGTLGLHGAWIAMATELCVRGLLMIYRQHTSKYYSRYKNTTEA